ncbi:MAG: hypothetical protein KC593_00975 [Myxococcales bacterium]|nr:hypothetical protein [Myxococcales bacterium]
MSIVLTVPFFQWSDFLRGGGTPTASNHSAICLGLSPLRYRSNIETIQ